MGPVALAHLYLRSSSLDGQAAGLLGGYAGIVVSLTIFGRLRGPGFAHGPDLVSALNGAYLGVFVFLSRRGREAARAFLRSVPLPRAAIRRGELLADLGLAALAAALLIPIPGAWAGSAAVRTFLLLLWGLTAGIAVEETGWRLVPSLCALVVAVVLVPAVAFFAADGPGAETWIRVATWALAGICAATLTWALRDRPFADRRPATVRGPQAADATQAVLFSFRILPGRTCGLLRFILAGNWMLALWILMAAVFAIPAYREPPEQVYAIWAVIVAMNAGNLVTMALHARATEFLLTRPISRRRLNAVPMAFTIALALIVPLCGIAGAVRRTDAAALSTWSDILWISLLFAVGFVGHRAPRLAGGGARITGRVRLLMAAEGLGWTAVLAVPVLPFVGVPWWQAPPFHPAAMAALIALCGTLAWRRLNRFEVA